MKFQGILDQDGLPNDRYAMLSQLGKELVSYASVINGSLIQSDVALLVSPDSRWVLQGAEKNKYVAF